MIKQDVIFFAEEMGDFLYLPSSVCEIIVKYLMEEKYKDVLEFIISRRKEIKKEFLGVNKDE